MKNPVTYDEYNENLQILTKRYLTSRDAYVTGYFFTTIDSIPPSLVSFMQKNYTGDWSEQKIIKMFTMFSVEVSLPQETLKTNSIPGIGGYSRTNPLFTQPGNNIGINFLLDQDLEITTLLTGWYRYITLVSDGRLEVEDDNPTANIFGCNFYYCTLLPNMTDIVFAFVGETCYPTNCLPSDFGHGVGVSDSLRHSMQFNLDYYDYWTKNNMNNAWMEKALKGKMQEFQSEMYNNQLTQPNNFSAIPTSSDFLVG